MAVEPNSVSEAAGEHAALVALADAAAAAARTDRPEQALRALVAAAARATDADLGLVRTLDPDAGQLTVRAVVGPGATAARLEGTRVPATAAEEAFGRLADELAADARMSVPVESHDGVGGSLELFRERGEFGAAAHAAARIVAGHLALILRAGPADTRRAHDALGNALRLAGEAVSAASGAHAAEHVARVVREAARAEAALLWQAAPQVTVLARAGAVASADEDRARPAAERALDRTGVHIEELGATIAASVRLGDPPLGILQLLFAREHAPPPDELDELSVFAARAAQSLRAADRARTTSDELAQTRALLAAVAEASSQLSLSHTVTTAIDRVGKIVGAERLAVYLREDERLVSAAARGLAGPHVRVAEALLELVLGPFRARGMVALARAADEPRLRAVRDAIGEAGIEAAVAVPLLVGNDTIGLLAAFPPSGRIPGANERELLAALSAQLAVAVQNAQLHERATRLGAERERALEQQVAASRHLEALYEISGSFTKQLSLETTLEAVVRTVVDNLDIDAAVVRVPDPRREVLVPRALKVSDEAVADALRAILYRAQPYEHPVAERVRGGEAVVLDAENAPLLAPFLLKGSTGAVLPIATADEVVATLTIVSLRPDRPIGTDMIEVAATICSHAALALVNARLYEQREEFAESMRRSLLPQVKPPVAGLDIGEVYAASARVEIGGDLYDYIGLDERRLAAVVGDVTGHGIDAAADMAMAKFVFRTIAREHTRPGALLTAANDVVVDEIAPGKFITMVYALVDGETGEVACAAAGHPPPRVVRSDGSVEALSPRGLALGVEAGQHYDEVGATLAPGDSIVLYTDGVIEARSGTSMFGFERLDRVLSRRRTLGAEDIAASVIQAARQFTGGELFDDCAVVVVKRTP